MGLFSGNWTLEHFIEWGIWALCLMFALSIHEVSHGRMADRLGDDTARRLGRLTMNPFAHLDWFGLLLILVGAPILWAKPVPVNTARMTRGKSYKSNMVKVAVAGAAANLIVAFIALVIQQVIILLATPEVMFFPGVPFVMMFLLSTLVAINLNLAIFNLLPIPPLDGFKVFGALLPERIYNRILQYERQIGLGLLIVIVVAPKILGTILATIRWPILWLMQQPINLIASLIYG